MKMLYIYRVFRSSTVKHLGNELKLREKDVHTKAVQYKKKGVLTEWKILQCQLDVSPKPDCTLSYSYSSTASFLGSVQTMK